MTLWWIGNQETFRQVADRFGTTRGNAHYIIMKTCEIIAERINDYVVWPSRDELWNESRGFRSLPNVIGVLDATDIEIKQPLHDLATYTTKDGLTAVKVTLLQMEWKTTNSCCKIINIRFFKVQAVCNSKKKFIDVSIGWPGSFHDARIYAMSSLSLTIEEKLQGTPYRIIADKGYALGTRVLTPYRDYGRLNPIQLNFNQLQDSERSLIENAYSLLKGKSRKLHFLDVTNLKYVPNIIATAIVLHNFIIDAEGDHVEGDWSDTNEEEDNVDIEEDPYDGLTRREIRDLYANSL